MRARPVVCCQLLRNTTVYRPVRRVAGGIVGALDQVVEDERDDATLLAVPKGLERGGLRRVQSLRNFERAPRGAGQLRALDGSVVVLRLQLDVLARFGERGAESIGHHATWHRVLNITRHGEISCGVPGPKEWMGGERTTMTQKERAVLQDCRTISRLAKALGAAVERLAQDLERWDAPADDLQEQPAPAERLQ